MNTGKELTEDEMMQLAKGSATGAGTSRKIELGGVKNWLEGFNKATDTISTYGTDKYGRNIGESNSDIYYSKPKTEVKILGMPPLVFTLVSLVVVVSLGVAIAKIGNKSIAK